MNVSAILALIGDLYGQIAELTDKLESITKERDTMQMMLDAYHEQQGSSNDELQGNK